MIRKHLIAGFLAGLTFAGGNEAVAQDGGRPGEAPAPPAKVRKIQDNSFLLEEAYNQEDGVVQNIQSFQLMKEGSWACTFTQEWPVPTQAHQFSYTVPYSRIDDGETVTGFGDVLLNYRYQAVFKGRVALAPRLSLVLPTGDPEEGLGGGSWGLQANVPLSVELADRWVMHWNLGATILPNAEGPDGSRDDTVGLNYGASAIYIVNDDFNLMVEAVGGSTETPAAVGGAERKNAFFLNPGFRYAIDFPGLQVVTGLSVPTGAGPSAGDVGVLFYLSFEYGLF